MARIRTVKPELFRHEELYEAELQEGLPLRLAFIGLFTACDREGRFKWRPRQLKLDVLPYDEIDFSRVLDALASRGFIEKYIDPLNTTADEYGHIPSFLRHQVINNREKLSILPEPPGYEILSDLPRDDHASNTRNDNYSGEREREGEGEVERKGKGNGNGKDIITSQQLQIADTAETQIMEKLNLLTGKSFKPVESNLKFIRARLAEGHSFTDIIDVVEMKVEKWQGGILEEYLRPATLFNAEKFNQYAGELPEWRRERDGDYSWLTEDSSPNKDVIEGELVNGWQEH